MLYNKTNICILITCYNHLKQWFSNLFPWRPPDNCQMNSRPLLLLAKLFNQIKSKGVKNKLEFEFDIKFE